MFDVCVWRLQRVESRVRWQRHFETDRPGPYNIHLLFTNIHTHTHIIIIKADMTHSVQIVSYCVLLGTTILNIRKLHPSVYYSLILSTYQLLLVTRQHWPFYKLAYTPMTSTN
jgi:hypothetical protein